MWAKKHSACIDCGTSASKHKAKGRCSTCYSKATYIYKPNPRPKKTTLNNDYITQFILDGMPHKDGCAQFKCYLCTKECLISTPFNGSSNANNLTYFKKQLLNLCKNKEQ